MKKKVIAILLTLAMIVTYLPTMVFAEDGANDAVPATGSASDVSPAEETPSAPSDVQVKISDDIDDQNVEDTVLKLDDSIKNGEDGLIGEEALPELNILKQAKVTVFLTGTKRVLYVAKAKQADDGNWYIKKPDDSIVDQQGYTFEGWTLNLLGSENLKWDKTPSFDGTQSSGWEKYHDVIYSRWEENEYTLKMINTFNKPTSKKNFVEFKKVKYSDVFTLKCPKDFSNRGLNFDGWAPEADKDPTLWDNEEVSVKNLLSDEKDFETYTRDDVRYIDMFAKWTDVEKNDVIYHAYFQNWFLNFMPVSHMPSNDKIAVGQDEYVISSSVPMLSVFDIDIPAPKFVGWNTKADGTGTTYQPEDVITGVDGRIDLYAMWSPSIYFVDYVLNGGDEESITWKNKFYVTGYAEFTILPTPTREGYVFTGWHYNQDLSDPAVEEFAPNETGHKTLYASWVEAEYNITFIDGFGGITTTVQKYGEKTIVPPNPVKSGMKFKGWDSEVAEVVTSDAVYTAKWEFASNPGFIDINGIATGDSNDIVLYFTLAGIALCAGVALVLLRRKKTN